jgi:glycosyltransferase involved in cell wall biosynthesis
VKSTPAAPLISVVTPFFNTEKYLAECIESVRKQTFRDWEYLLINNCSTDSSREIALECARGDPRITIIDSDRFRGQVPNYNYALTKTSAGSKYTKVVQADDWLFPECLERMLEIAERDDDIVLVSSYQLTDRGVLGTGLPVSTEVFPGRSVCRKALTEGFFPFGTPTSLLMRADALRKRSPVYSESSLHEDTELCYELLSEEGKFGFCHQVLTYTRIDEGSTYGIVQSFGPTLLDKYIVTKKYGRLFLTDDERGLAERRIRKRYFEYLCRSALVVREGHFWRYHRAGLATIGERPSWMRLLPFLWKPLFDFLFNPKLAIGELVRARSADRKVSQLLSR